MISLPVGERDGTCADVARATQQQPLVPSCEIAEAELDDLRLRPRPTRWPGADTVGDWSLGIPLTYSRNLCVYWLDQYD